MTPIGVKTSGMRNLYVLVIYAPESRTTILLRRISSRPFASIAAGAVLRVRRKRLRVRSIVHHERVTIVSTEEVTKRTNVVPMPVGDDSTVAQFLRYHVLVRVFDGDPDAWLAQLESRGGDGGDLRFARWIRSRLRQDPSLMTSIRQMVDATPFWHAAEA